MLIEVSAKLFLFNTKLKVFDLKPLHYTAKSLVLPLSHHFNFQSQVDETKAKMRQKAKEIQQKHKEAHRYGRGSRGI